MKELIYFLLHLHLCNLDDLLLCIVIIINCCLVHSNSYAYGYYVTEKNIRAVVEESQKIN